MDFIKSKRLKRFSDALIRTQAVSPAMNICDPHAGVFDQLFSQPGNIHIKASLGNNTFIFPAFFEQALPVDHGIHSCHEDTEQFGFFGCKNKRSITMH